jgi:hypothetical protein
MAWVSVDVLAQERKSIPLMDEFALRLVEEGVDTPALLAQVLGLDEKLVASTVADQLVLDRMARVSVADGTSRLRLTSIGSEMSRDLAAVTPKEQVLGYAFDLLTQRVTAYPRSLLVNAQQASALGLRRLPKVISSVGDGDITPAALNALLAERRPGESAIEILACRRVKQRASLFLPVKLLVYCDSQGRESQVAVAVEGEISRVHELALNQAGGAERVGLRVGRPADPITLDPLLQKIRRDEQQVRSLWLRACGAAEGSDDRADDDASLALDELTSEAVRAVYPFEFPDLLQSACADAKRRLLISSTRLQLTSSDASWVDRLEQRLRAGVEVSVIYRYVELGGSRSTTRRLVDLRRRYRDSCRISQIDGSLGEVLAWDDCLVVGSYPWLSAHGDLSRQRRRETGTVIRRADAAQRKFDEYGELVRTAAGGAPPMPRSQ